MNARQVVIAGAGPAGLMAAISAAQAGFAVTVLEYLPSVGRKLLASGAGKCNFTNMLTAEAMAERFAPEQRRFVRPALLNFPPEAVRDFFLEHGVKYKLVDDFYCFPVSEKASDILDVLVDKARFLQVNIICNSPVTELTVKDCRIVQVFSGQAVYDCDYFIAAGGGPGFPRLGGHGSLDKILTGCGVSCVPRTPALCGLKSNACWVQSLAGIVLEKITLTLDKKNITCGTLLFTGDGISGPAALDMAGRVAKLLAAGNEKVLLAIDFLTQYSPEELEQILTQSRQHNGKRLLHNVFNSFLPQALLHNITEYLHIADTPLNQLSRSAIRNFLAMLKSAPLEVTATDSWNKAMASTGGVDRTSLKAKTLQSRELDNLYCAGEMIDVDGPCGGYNSQWALSSGYLAGSLQ